MVGSPLKPELLIKKVIREVADQRGVAKRHVSRHEILSYMIDNNLGKQWVTLNLISSVRRRLPESYQENFET